MAEPTRAFAMSPLQQALCMDKLLIAGHPREIVERCVKYGEWGLLPLTEGEVKQFTCPSCGAKPSRSPAGRIVVGCWGTCQQRAFADLRDETVQERARKLSHAQASGVEATPITVRRQRGLWQDD